MHGLWAGSPVGMCERQPHIHVSLLLFVPLFPSENKQVNSLKKSFNLSNFFFKNAIFLALVTGLPEYSEYNENFCIPSIL